MTIPGWVHVYDLSSGNLTARDFFFIGPEACSVLGLPSKWEGPKLCAFVETEQQLSDLRGCLQARSAEYFLARKVERALTPEAE